MSYSPSYCEKCGHTPCQCDLHCTFCGVKIRHNATKFNTKCGVCLDEVEGPYCAFCGKTDYNCEYCKDKPRRQQLSNEELLNRLERTERILYRLITVKLGPYDVLGKEALDLIDEQNRKNKK